MSDNYQNPTGSLQILVVLFSILAITEVVSETPLPSERIKTLSKSPDGNVEIITTIPKGEKPDGYIYFEKSRPHVAKNIVYSGIYLRDRRNAPEIWYDLDVENWGGAEARIEWLKDSNGFTIIYGDNKVWAEKFFVLRKDARSSRMIYERPRLPNVVRTILDNSKERPKAFNLPEPVEYVKGKFIKAASGWKLTEPEITDSGVKNEPVEFKVTYFLKNQNGAPAEGTWQYECVFTTMDWVGYDLIQITRIGKAPSLAYKPEHPDDQPLILYDKNISGN